MVFLYWFEDKHRVSIKKMNLNLKLFSDLLFLKVIEKTNYNYPQ